MSQPTPPQVEYRKAADLVPYARNSRTHSDEQIAQLMSSLVEFGWTRPLLVDDKGIVAGHGTTQAALRLYAQGKVIKLPGGAEIPEGMAPVIDCSGWTDVQRRAYIIADNKSAINAGWEMNLLHDELLDIRDSGLSLNLIGFNDAELLFIRDAELVKLPELNSGDRAPFQTMTFTLHDSQVETIKEAISIIKATGLPKDAVNENGNGNALAEICAEFIRNHADS